MAFRFRAGKGRGYLHKPIRVLLGRVNCNSVSLGIERERFLETCPDIFLRQRIFEVKRPRCGLVAVAIDAHGFRVKLAEALGVIVRGHQQKDADAATVRVGNELLEKIEFYVECIGVS